MPNPRFGTDGVRGVANTELTPELALALGRASARVLGTPSWVVGRDTRLSGPMLQAAFQAGLASEGAHVTDVGVLPTPGVAFNAARAASPGAVVSASHNRFQDNGIKLFGMAGSKLRPDDEAAIEAVIASLEGSDRAEIDYSPTRRAGRQVGSISVDSSDAAAAYREHLRQGIEGRRLDGLRMVLDCANGASSVLAPEVFAALLGATVHTIACTPDGLNINDGCGSTDPKAICHAVVDSGAHFGLAFDGDADRALAVDHRGELLDGDHLLALFALDRLAHDRLPGRTVVVTVMSNLGFRHAMARHGIEVKETPVGDRHVLAALEDGGFVLGGEQSGHIIFRDIAHTGDGILSGLMLADLIVRSGRSLAALAAGLIKTVPQVLVNVEVAHPQRFREAKAVWEAVSVVEGELGADGRIVLRPSGTEPVVRVMVEARPQERAYEIAERLSAVIRVSLEAS